MRLLEIRQSDVVTYVSNQINDEIKRVDENKTTHLFRHGTYDNFYKPGAPPKELIKLFKANKEVIFFSPRLLKPIYQNDKIIEAFSDFYKTSNKSRLLLAGDTKQNTKYVSRLKNIIKNEKLVNNVHFLGYLSKNEMLDYYRLSDIVVSYPISDGMPATVFEAMAIGKPLILSDTISSNEIFTTGYDTIICDKNNTNELADSMKLLWDNSELQKKITANAKETFSKYGDANKFISELEMIYKHLLQ
jgi:glycosyltransferase involved in cell wall biosynthesis